MGADGHDGVVGWGLGDAFRLWLWVGPLGSEGMERCLICRSGWKRFVCSKGQICMGRGFALLKLSLLYVCMYV